MTIIQAIILGAIQGLTEMLPISSSAHLVIVPWLLGYDYQGLAFDVALHLGTLVAVLSYFWKDWWKIIKFGFIGIKERKISKFSQKLPFYLLIASVPGAIIGYLFESYAESVFRSPLVISATLVLAGLLLWYADHNHSGERDLKSLKVFDALKIGLSQAIAIIPGVSRSGITMTTGLMLGFKREDAAKFSFMMSAPIIFGAALVKVPDINAELFLDKVFWIALASAAASSLFAIGFLLKLVKTKNFDIFVFYRIFLAFVIILLIFIGGR